MTSAQTVGAVHSLVFADVDLGASQRHILHAEETAHVGADQGVDAFCEESQAVDHKCGFVLELIGNGWCLEKRRG